MMTTRKMTHTGNTLTSALAGWFLLTIALAGLAGVVLLEAAGCGVIVNARATLPDIDYETVAAVLGGLCFAVLGRLLTLYRPHNRISWLCAFIGVAFALMLVFTSYADCGLAGTLALPGVAYAAWLKYVTPLWAIMLVMILLPLWFPTGQSLSPRWRRFTWWSIAVIGGSILLAALLPGPMQYNGLEDTGSPIDNPFGLGFLPTAVLGPVVAIAIFLGLIAATLAAIASLILRWRRSRGNTRQQLKWFTFILATAGTSQLLSDLVGTFLYPAMFDTWLYGLVLAIVFLGFPLVIGLAIFKYRLYDIDLIIRRTLVYTLLTVLLALTYFGSVVLFERVATVVTGQGSTVGVVVSTLIIAALFNPLRTRTQALIDRHFYRRKYDAAHTLARFAAAARDEVNLDRLVAELVGVVEETMQPAHVSTWLKGSNARAQSHQDARF
jgi:hypothetical protein